MGGGGLFGIACEVRQLSEVNFTEILHSTMESLDLE